MKTKQYSKGEENYIAIKSRGLHNIRKYESTDEFVRCNFDIDVRGGLKLVFLNEKITLKEIEEFINKYTPNINLECSKEKITLNEFEEGIANNYTQNINVDCLFCGVEVNEYIPLNLHEYNIGTEIDKLIGITRIKVFEIEEMRDVMPKYSINDILDNKYLGHKEKYALFDGVLQKVEYHTSRNDGQFTHYLYCIV